MVAIGSVHEHVRQTAIEPDELFHRAFAPPVQNWFALSQCNKAINIMTKRGPDSTGYMPALAFCILFIAFEVLQNRLTAALSHLRSGLSIIQAWTQTEKRSSQMSEEEIWERVKTILERFGDSFQLDGRFPDRSPTPMLDNEGCCRPAVEMPESFSGVEQAAAVFKDICESTFRSLPLNAAEQTAHEQGPYGCRSHSLRPWRIRYRRLQETLRREALDQHTRRHLQLLNIHYLVVKILQDTRFDPEEMGFDVHLPTFQKIINACQQTINAEREHMSSESRMTVSLDLGLIMPLYFTAVRCRDPRIRRAALHLLASVARYEGIWLSWIAGQVAKAVIDLEEGGLRMVQACVDIPMESRIEMLEVRYDPYPTTSGKERAYFAPAVQLHWKQGIESEDCTRVLTVPFPKLTDVRPVGQPYVVRMTRKSDPGAWKLLMGRKCFQ